MQIGPQSLDCQRSLAKFEIRPFQQKSQNRSRGRTPDKSAGSNSHVLPEMSREYVIVNQSDTRSSQRSLALDKLTRSPICNSNIQREALIRPRRESNGEGRRPILHSSASAPSPVRGTATPSSLVSPCLNIQENYPPIQIVTLGAADRGSNTSLPTVVDQFGEEDEASGKQAAHEARKERS